MSVVLINDSTLTDIADAIREQNGTQTTYLPSDMPDAIAAIEGGGGGIPDITVTSPQYAFAGPVVATLWPNLKSHITLDYNNFSLQNNRGSLFAYCEIENLSDLNIQIGTPSISSNPSINDPNLFNYSKIKYLPSLSLGEWHTSPSAMYLNWTSLFAQCQVLQQIPDGFFSNLGSTFWNTIHNSVSGQYSNFQGMFNGCRRLKKIPKDELKLLVDPRQVAFPNACMLNSYTFMQCYCLQELENVPLPDAVATSNLFGAYYPSLYSLKNYIFDMSSNNQPYVRSYKNQTLIIRSDYGVGWQSPYMDSTKRVTDAASYEALKNEDEWYTSLPEYSRYNHDSAVRTINSLPDTSEYLATEGGTNTITFENATNKGSATDGGAIADLTAAEIAVATAKGWTVTLA